MGENSLLNGVGLPSLKTHYLALSSNFGLHLSRTKSWVSTNCCQTNLDSEGSGSHTQVLELWLTHQTWGKSGKSALKRKKKKKSPEQGLMHTVCSKSVHCRNWRKLRKGRQGAPQGSLEDAHSPQCTAGRHGGGAAAWRSKPSPQAPARQPQDPDWGHAAHSDWAFPKEPPRHPLPQQALGSSGWDLP